jgi:adenine-specific DNA-methyltransferase
MARWVTSTNPEVILDPAVGHGGLLRECEKICPGALLQGIEHDLETLDDAAKSAPRGTRLTYGDYIRLEVEQVGGIIANPPYVKAQHLNYNECDWVELQTSLGTQLDRLTNLYGLFLLKIYKDLRPGGRASILIPSEFLNANFGVEIKKQLLSVIKPAGIVVFTAATRLFESAITTSCIVFLEKNRKKAHELVGARANGIDEANCFVDFLLGQPSEISSLTSFADKEPEEKWLNCLLHEQVQTRRWSARIGDYFGCKRGIATGANGYFTLNRSTLKMHGLQKEDFEFCVTKANDVGGLVFREDNFMRLFDQDKRCLLLNPRGLSANMDRYLALGVAQGITTKFLPSHRPTWYLPENRAVATAWIPVFSRGDVRFTLNLSGAKNLTCFHGLYGKNVSEAQSAFVVLFLNSSFGQEAFRCVNRFYGDGLNKVEPKDVEAIGCPSLPDIDAARGFELVKILEDASRLIRSECSEFLARSIQTLFPNLVE